MRIENQRVGFVGFGHMGQVICAALERARLIPRSQIVFHRRDPSKAKQNEQEFKITATSLSHLVESSDLLILCVRPNQLEGVLKEISAFSLSGKMWISIAAGIKISFLQKRLGEKAQIARAMPNIASSVGEGMTLLSFGEAASSEFRSLAGIFFGAFGKTLAIREAQMDIGCALAGSGPAFVLELIEAMARQGEREGLPYSQALSIAAQTFLGAAQLVRSGALPEDLLHTIATPGGTTQAGLEEMRKGGAAILFSDALSAAAERSSQISSQHSS